MFTGIHSYFYFLQVPSLLSAQKPRQFFKMLHAIPLFFWMNWAEEQALLMDMLLHML